MAKSSNGIGRWKKSALVALNLYDAYILKKYGAFSESDIKKTAFKGLFRPYGSKVAIQEAVRRQSAIGGSQYISKRISGRCFSLCGNKRKRFGLRVGFGFSGVSICEFMFIHCYGSRVVGFKRLSLHVDEQWGLEN
jgi:hypothetical protein